MAVTISTHNGSAIRQEHNTRNPHVTGALDHIDGSGNYEVWHHEPVRTSYHRLFDDALGRYNARQKRPDRRIKNYYSHIEKDAKKHPAYEMIIGIYQGCDSKLGKEIMKEFVDGWQERNPNLELIGAYYHADEAGEPHVHIDYVPVAHGYQRGMDTQSALVKALEEQGFQKVGKRTAQIQWEARENKHLEELCQKAGLEVVHPREGKEHLHTELYKLTKETEATAHALDEKKAELAQAQTDLIPLRTEYAAKKAVVEAIGRKGANVPQFEEGVLKERKALFTGKRSYELSEQAYEQARKSLSVAAGLSKAQKIVDSGLEKVSRTGSAEEIQRLRHELDEAKQEIKGLTIENRNLENNLNRLQRAVSRLPEPVQSQVYRAFNPQKRNQTL